MSPIQAILARIIPLFLLRYILLTIYSTKSTAIHEYNAFLLMLYDTAWEKVLGVPVWNVFEFYNGTISQWKLTSDPGLVNITVLP